MKTKKLALAALNSLLANMEPEELKFIPATEANTKEAIAALEADIAKPSEPVAFLLLHGFDGEEFSDDFQVEIVTKEAEKLQEALVKFSDQDGVTIPLYTTPQEPADRNPYGWQVQGLRDTFKGDHAEMDAKAEAARVGGTAYAFPIYIDPTAVTESTP